MKIYTKKFVDEQGAVFSVEAENDTEETLLDACVTPDAGKLRGQSKLRRDGSKKFALTLPVFNGEAV